MSTAADMAPELEVGRWFNTPTPITLAGLRGRVVALHTFQMLCPGCISHGIPQATRLRKMFAQKDVAVIGLHTVFEHHSVMTEEALAAFIHEYRLDFPIGVDIPGTNNPVPRTMQKYALRGTPSLVLIDRSGRLRLSHFGQIEDMQLGAVIGQLLAEPGETQSAPADSALSDAGSGRCEVGANGKRTG
ncbi:MAG TPA: redoxin domain-containing protein [Dokdonella sp.]|uniref:redoxin domain-containing protein n=1 Tax=Dokdonella sp. TaxID=2291710 RepID=UPI002D8002C6|nr:redoxin domain-containing protein [Dokdonella sp.]HET9032550.1 redoxin domain-containing protein [Dokdonella sp.]